MKSKLKRKKLAKKIQRRKKFVVRKAKPNKKARQLKNHAGNMPRYTLNRDFQFIQELRDLILKSSPAEKEEITARLLKLGRIKLAVIAGVFLNKENQENSATDLFIVSDDLDRKKFNSFLRLVKISFE